jgi:hypothetical protein
LTKYVDKEITVKFNGGREGTYLEDLLLEPGCGMRGRSANVDL